MPLNTKIRLTMLCLSGFELYSRWMPLRSLSLFFFCPLFYYFYSFSSFAVCTVQGSEKQPVSLGAAGGGGVGGGGGSLFNW